jgi:hypothetical protein
MFVTGTDQFEEYGGFRLIFADVGEIVEDQQMKAVEPVDGGFKREFATRDLQPLNQIRGASEQNAKAVFHQRQADRGREVRLPTAGRTRGILPNITTPMGGSFIGITLATVRASRS